MQLNGDPKIISVCIELFRSQGEFAQPFRCIEAKIGEIKWEKTMKIPVFIVAAGKFV